jgi:prepilin peptidase CpaA
VLSIIWILFVAIMFASAIVDVATYRIPNELVLALVALFLVAALIHWPEVAWLGHLGSLCLIMGAGIFLYAFGQMGAGDVKLLSAVSLWSSIYSLVPLLLWVSVCASAGMLVILSLRFLLPRLQSLNFLSRETVIPKVLSRGRGIPYGIGIGPGAIIASFSFPSWFWQQ